jgi:hypothetical protein
MDGSAYQFGKFECDKISLIPDNEGLGVFLPIRSFVQKSMIQRINKSEETKQRHI